VKGRVHFGDAGAGRDGRFKTDLDEILYQGVDSSGSVNGICEDRNAKVET
jgi:hypothetical protein